MVVYSRDRFDSVLEKAAGVDRGRVTEQALQAVPSVEVEDLRIVRDHQQSHACAKVDRWYATSRPQTTSQKERKWPANQSYVPSGKIRQLVGFAFVKSSVFWQRAREIWFSCFFSPATTSSLSESSHISQKGHNLQEEP